MIRYRNMTEGDIPAGISLCRSAGWNQLEDDWKIFLQLSKYGNRVAVNADGKVVGTVATITYDDRFSWIGMVLVDPSMKRQGIGSQLLHESFELLHNQQTIKLDATPAGREVYLKLGFNDEYVLSRMTGMSSFQRENKMQDIDSVLATDREIFGASREPLLRSYNSIFPRLFYSKNPSNYCFARKGFNFTQIGPLVADSVDNAIEVARAIMATIEGPVALDVIENSQFSKWLASLGFTEQRKLTRMYRGTNASPGIPERQFAILGPEFG